MANLRPRRIELQELLESVLGSGNVYFQPPEDRRLNYPCIVYQRDNASVDHADDIPYRYAQRSQVTLIDRNPDSDVLDGLTLLPCSSFNRHFETSGLNHDVFSIYY